MYVGDEGILLASFNGDNPRVYPASPKSVAPPRSEAPVVQTGPRRDGAIDAWIIACKGEATALTNFD
jgi:hypothetical protein